MSKTTIQTGGIADDAVSEEHLDATALTGNTALAATPATTDEILISDAGTLKRLDFLFLMNRPAFHVDFDDSSSTSIAHDTGTKMLFDTERIDTDSAYDNSSNYRFTPQVAGKYFVYASIGLNSSTDYPDKYFICEIRKNGSTAILGNNPSSFYTCATANMIVDMNGSSDYVECFGYHTIGSTQDTVNSKFYSFFGGYRLIS